MMKYIRFQEHGFVLFDGDDCHCAMARRHGGTPVSAGIVLCSRGGLICGGESLTLGLKSHESDTELLRQTFKV